MDLRVRTVLLRIEPIERPLLSSLSAEDLAASVNLSASRLRCLFRTETGVPLASYVRRVRLERAERLLAGSFMTVKQIAAATGFADEGQLLRAFKKAYGVPPGRYRCQRRETSVARA